MAGGGGAASTQFGAGIASELHKAREKVESALSKRFTGKGTKPTPSSADKIQPGSSKPQQPATTAPSMKKGGKVKRTGLYRLHKGETVKTAKQSKNSKHTRRKRVAHRSLGMAKLMHSPPHAKKGLTRKRSSKR